MAIVVVGGHTRNIGKTGLVAGLIAALPERRWTAFKITQFGHGVCSANGESCDCADPEHPVAFSEERDTASGTDTSRFLAAGAARCFWVRTRQGGLAEAMPRLRRELARAEDAILESNSVLRFLQPDLFLSVLDADTADFKESARHFLDRADGVVLTGSAPIAGSWPQVSLRLIERARRFQGTPAEPCSKELAAFVRDRLAAIDQPTATAHLDALPRSVK